jgi:hypothetical protein
MDTNDILEVLRDAEMKFVALYRSVAPLGNYNTSDNYCADRDESVQKVRATIFTLEKEIHERVN